jgi:Rieske 2Fe-2S family protein
MECYHCQPAHPEYSKHHALARPFAQTRHLDRPARLRAEAMGIFIADVDQYGLAAHPGSESVSVFRSPLLEPTAEALSGARPAPLMGDFSGFDGNSTYVDIGPLSDFLAYVDHGVIYRFIPRGALQTDMEVIWLVHGAAREGEDFDVESLTALWKTTSLQDKAIVEWNQAGVNSRFFKPGPYSDQESYARRFTEWYLSELNGQDSIPGAEAGPLASHQA